MKKITLEERVEELEHVIDVILERENQVWLRQYDPVRDFWRRLPIPIDTLIKAILKHLGLEISHCNDFEFKPIGTSATFKEDYHLQRKEEKKIPEER